MLDTSYNGELTLENKFWIGIMIAIICWLVGLGPILGLVVLPYIIFKTMQLILFVIAKSIIKIGLTIDICYGYLFPNCLPLTTKQLWYTANTVFYISVFLAFMIPIL